MMSGIRGKDTRPERLIRQGLHRLGYRFRLHRKDLPGRPDLVFPGRHAVILVNGCFWHGHDCHLFRLPGTRTAFWRSKIARNIARDHEVMQALAGKGWRICTVFECQLKGRTRQPAESVLNQCAAFLDSDIPMLAIGGDQRVKLCDEA